MPPRWIWPLLGIGLAAGVAYLLLQPSSEPAPQAGASLPATQDTPPWFADVTAERGLNFIHDPGPVGRYFMPQIIGSGGAFLDFDNDGRLDIYLVQNGGPQSGATNRLYRQTPEGRFADVSAGSGLDVAGWGMGVAVGDVDNDGRVDVLLTEYGRIRLFRNSGNGVFADVTKESGLDNPLWATSAAFFDYDRDGWLDLVVVNYVDYDPSVDCYGASGKKDYCHPDTFGGTPSKLFHNLGNRSGTVRFEDVSLASGVGRLGGPALGVVCADFTGDRWPDIFVANDSKPNHLWVNRRNGTFAEEAMLRGIAQNRMGRAEANMGVALGDLDEDGLFDVLVTHLSEETHTLWKQGPRGTFTDRTVAAGIAASHWRGTGFGAVLADFDRDGRLDAAVVNGRVSEPRSGTSAAAKGSGSAAGFFAPYLERNQLFANDGRGGFQDLSLANPAFTGQPAVSRGLVCGDFDNDGAVDLLVTAIAGPARLFRNAASQHGHWLQVRALDETWNRDAYGAEIIVSAGSRQWSRLIDPGYSYLCSNDPRAHFGLGAAARYDGIRVVWPDGEEQTFPGGLANQSITLRRARTSR